MKDQFKVLIVEDEKAALDRICEMAVWGESNFSVSGTAGNGKEALEFVLKDRPDIIITDIEMPVLNGLDFIREIRNHGLNTPVIILSCYESFFYAKRAMDLGVKDYLLKDFMAEEALYLALKKVERYLSGGKESGERCPEEGEPGERFQVESPADSILTLSLHQILENINKGDLPSDRWVEDIGGFNGFALLFLKVDNWSSCKERVGDLTPCIRKILFPEIRHEVAHLEGENYLILLASSGEGGAVLGKTRIMDIANIVHSQLAEIKGISVTIAASSPFHTFIDFPENLDHLRNLIKYQVFLGKNRVLFSDKPENIVPVDPAQLEEKISRLKHLVLLEKSGENLGLLAEIYRKELTGMMQYNYIEYVNSTILSILMNAIERKSVDLQELLGMKYLPIMELEALGTVEEMYLWFRNIFIKLFRISDEEAATAGLNRNIRKAIRIIRTEYQKDLSLESLAERVGVHKVYLSRLFKQEAGISYYEYLQNYRIGKAKLLLESTEMKMFEIALQTGFHSYDQFCVVFRKITDQTPSEYRKKNLDRKENLLI